MKNKTNNNDNNPYKRILDDAGRSLRDNYGLDFGSLKNIPDDKTNRPKIPFPYGGNKAVSK